MTGDETKTREDLIRERDQAREALRHAQAQWSLVTRDSEQQLHQLEESVEGLSGANRHLHEVDRLRSRFFSNMNHELRTPLNSVIGFLEDAIDGLAGPLNGEQQRYLGHALNSAEHLLSVINDVLDVAFLESGKTLLRLQSVRLADVVARANDIMEPLLHQRGQLYTVAPLEDLPPVTADPAKLLQILLNLLSNANKYTRDGGRIGLDAERRGDFLAVRVRDDGIGIRQEDLPRLFDEFTQIGRASCRERV